MNNNEATINMIKHARARVAVITPTYNRADLIEHAMKSVLAQSFTDYIYIILDDGSTDNTKKIVQDFIKGKENCFYLYHNNVGEAETVNIVWGLCKSEYFVQVNSDDTIEPNLLSEMVKVLDEKPEYVVAYPDFYIINKSGDIIEDFKNLDWNFVDALSAFSCYPATPGTVIRKSAFKHMRKIKDGRYKYINDVKMYWNMALVGNFIHVSKPLASWRSHTSNISTTRYKSIGEVYKWADEYFSQKDLPKEVKDAEEKCRQKIDRYCASLIENSDIETAVVDYVKSLSNKYQTLMEENKLLEAKNDSLASQKQELTQEIERFIQSTSWKVTRPLRETTALLKKLINIRKA
jgi:glycosyltransferase involved in cell wall biosynthesis